MEERGDRDLLSPDSALPFGGAFLRAGLERCLELLDLGVQIIPFSL